ncbi:transcription elongation factor GreB [Oceanospirillum linum]|uniref:Transcription elongation factor GreB n=2 Tax=Oceanospirillum linum TaxID=966 RepID=A0A1T1HG24_OCELI|nr:transcription elongation factor GreB [Oceanospirillum linum]OOV88762.1 transcription elongation factor GreB [Oceanospirillum linum]SEG00598.1 transcription elongation factor GreB [Oleiphilus messinensis]SMP22163.1 transcription elongation factor GreB [Oceanospirillum linum]
MKGRNMQRWRDPAKDPRREKKTNLITPEGYEVLQSERNFLWKVRHPELAQKVQEAAAQGDRSENADYTYNKQLLNKTLGRIRHLDKRLDLLTVVDKKPDDQERIFFSARIELEDNEGKRMQIRIVGPDEADLKEGKINIDSPMARSLLGKTLDDEIRVQAPGGEQVYYVLSVDYD